MSGCSEGAKSFPSGLNRSARAVERTILCPKLNVYPVEFDSLSNEIRTYDQKGLLQGYQTYLLGNEEEKTIVSYEYTDFDEIMTEKVVQIYPQVSDTFFVNHLYEDSLLVRTECKESESDYSLHDTILYFPEVKIRISTSKPPSWSEDQRTIRLQVVTDSFTYDDQLISTISKEFGESADSTYTTYKHFGDRMVEASETNLVSGVKVVSRMEYGDDRYGNWVRK